MGGLGEPRKGCASALVSAKPAETREEESFPASASLLPRGEEHTDEVRVGGRDRGRGGA